MNHLEHVKALRKYYSGNNKVGKMLGEIAKDIESNKTRVTVQKSAKALLKNLDPGSTAARAIDVYLKQAKP